MSLSAKVLERVNEAKRDIGKDLKVTEHPLKAITITIPIKHQENAEGHHWFTYEGGEKLHDAIRSHLKKQVVARHPHHSIMADDVNGVVASPINPL